VDERGFFGSLDATRVAEGDLGDILEVGFVLAVVERDDEAPVSSELF
jgi:hypothetical protein